MMWLLFCIKSIEMENIFLGAGQEGLALGRSHSQLGCSPGSVRAAALWEGKASPADPACQSSASVMPVLESCGRSVVRRHLVVFCTVSYCNPISACLAV